MRGIRSDKGKPEIWAISEQYGVAHADMHLVGVHRHGDPVKGAVGGYSEMHHFSQDTT